MSRLRAIACGVLAAIVATACGGEDGGTSEEATSRAAALGVELHAPSGWTTSNDGLVAARSRADLTAAVPAGPRVRVVEPDTRDANLVAAIEAEPAEAGDREIVDGPEHLSVRGRKAFRITLRDSAVDGNAAIVRRYLAAKSPTGDAVLFILEAPAESFDSDAAALDGVPGWTSS